MSKRDDIREGYRRGKAGSSDSTGWFDTPESQRARDQAFQEGALDRERDLERERIQQETESDRDERERELEAEKERYARELLEEQERTAERAAERQEEILSEHLEELRELQEEKARAERKRLKRFEFVTANASTLQAKARVQSGNQLQQAELFGEALQMYREASQLNPALLEPHWHMAATFVSLDQLDEAQAEFVKFLKLLRHYGAADTIQWWCKAFETVHHSYSAQEEVQRILGRSFDQALSTLDESALQLASKLTELGRESQAIQLLRSLAQGSAAAVPSLRLLAWLNHFGLKEEALELIQRVRDVLRTPTEKIFLAALEVDVHWQFDKTKVLEPMRECLRSIGAYDRDDVRNAFIVLQTNEIPGSGIRLTPELYLPLIGALEEKYGEWAPEIEQSFKDEVDAEAIRVYNSNREHPVRPQGGGVASAVRVDAEMRLQGLWANELERWSGISKQLQRPVMPLPPEQPEANSSDHSRPGPLILAVAGGLVLLVSAVFFGSRLQNAAPERAMAPSPIVNSSQPVVEQQAGQEPESAVPRTPHIQNSTPTNLPLLGSYEAESASLTGSAQINRQHSGYSGSGYVDGYGFNGEGATTTFRVSVDSANRYEVGLRYANATGRAMTLSIYVNGIKTTRTELWPLPYWDYWREKVEILPLATGTNTIAYRYDSGDTGNVNLDSIRVGTSVQTDLQPTPEPSVPVTSRSSSPSPASAPANLTRFTVLHRHGRGGFSGAIVREILNGANADGPKFCRGELSFSRTGFSFRTLATSDTRRDDVRVTYDEIKKVERKEAQHFRIETVKRGNWDFLSETAIVEQIEKLLEAKSLSFKR